MLQRASEKANGQHNQHRGPPFQIVDKGWLHLQEERFNGMHMKLKPLRYGCYTILERIGENAFKLNIPP